jgi:hypothetical protein
MITATLRRKTTIAAADDFEKRRTGVSAKILPYLQRQPGFVAHEIARVGDAGWMTETTTWRTEDDCRRYLRGGAAAMCATWLDWALPTAPFPDGNWVRTTDTAD